MIADFADLFETQRNDCIKRDESLRFFLASIEGRLRTDIRNEIFGRENKGHVAGGRSAGPVKLSREARAPDRGRSAHVSQLSAVTVDSSRFSSVASVANPSPPPSAST